MGNFKVGDVIQFTQVDVFEYEGEENYPIELYRNYIIVDMFDSMVILYDGEMEYLLSILCCEFFVKIRDTDFKIGDKIKFEHSKYNDIPNYTNLKLGKVYEVIELSIDDLPVIHDGTKEFVLFMEELLFATRVIEEQKQVPKRKPKPRQKKKIPNEKDYQYVPFSKEMEKLQQEIYTFGITTLVDNALDNKDFDMLLRIVSDPKINFVNKLH